MLNGRSPHNSSVLRPKQHQAAQHITNTVPAGVRDITRFRSGLTRCGERSRLRITVRFTVSRVTAQDAASGSDAGSIVMGQA